MEGEHDVLSDLNNTRVALWMHDVLPLLSYIEKKAIAQFKVHKDSMKVMIVLIKLG